MFIFLWDLKSDTLLKVDARTIMMHLAISDLLENQYTGRLRGFINIDSVVAGVPNNPGITRDSCFQEYHDSQYKPISLA